MCLFLNGGSLNKVLGPKTPQQQGIVLRPAENVSFFSVLFFYCELHMVDMCECVSTVPSERHSLQQHLSAFFVVATFGLSYMFTLGEFNTKAASSVTRRRERER